MTLRPGFDGGIDVYAANRGHDTITAFRINPESGKLTLIECEPVRGSWPRNFNIDPSGEWLLTAGRDSNNLALFKIDAETGELTYTRTMVMAPTPICVLFGFSGNLPRALPRARIMGSFMDCSVHYNAKPRSPTHESLPGFLPLCHTSR